MGGLVSKAESTCRRRKVGSHFIGSPLKGVVPKICSGPTRSICMSVGPHVIGSPLQGVVPKFCSGPTRASCMPGRSHALFNNSDRAAAHLDRLMRLGSAGNESQNIHKLSTDMCFWFRLIQKSFNRSPVSRLLCCLFFQRSGAIALPSSSHGP